MKVLKVNKTLKVKYKKQAKAELKNNENVKNLMLDMRDHFKQKNTWPLNYHIYLEMSKLTNTVFNNILELKGYVLYYDEDSSSMMIKVKKKK